jgi:predicted PolB exonuclease-like 3'-5' exonuclease
MSDQSVIVWDLETVPDLAAAARMLDLSNATDAEVREALGTGFPKHPLHKIVCIGALIASRHPDGWRIDALGAPHIGQRTEAKLISDFMEKIARTSRDAAGKRSRLVFENFIRCPSFPAGSAFLDFSPGAVTCRSENL